MSDAPFMLLGVMEKMSPFFVAMSSSSSSSFGGWSFDCFLNAGNGRNLKDFLILRSDSRFVAACDFGGFVYVWNTDTKTITVRAFFSSTAC